MSDLSSSDVLTTIENFRVIDRACREQHITVAELYDELERERSGYAPYTPESLRALIRKAVEQKNLRAAAREKRMSTASVQRLQETIGGVNLGGRRRDAIPTTQETFARQADILAQGSLFDAEEAAAPREVVAVNTDNIYDDIGWPLG